MRSARFKAAHFTRISSSSSPQTGSGASPILSTDSSPGFSTTTAFMDQEAAQFGGGNPPRLTRPMGLQGTGPRQRGGPAATRRRKFSYGCFQGKVDSRNQVAPASAYAAAKSRARPGSSVGVAPAI